MTEDSDKAAEALSSIGLPAGELIEDFAKGGDSARTAFETIATKLGEIEDPLDRNQVGVELFGTKFEDLGADAVIAMSKTNDSITGSKETLDSINEVQYDTIGEALAGVGRKAVTGILIPIQDRIMPGINKAIGSTIDFIETAAGAFKAFISGDESAEDILMSYGLDPAKFDKIAQFGNLLQENLSKIRDRGGEAFDKIGKAVDSFKSNVLPALNTFLGAVQNIFNRLVPIVKPIVAAVVGFALQNFAKLYAFWQSDGQQILQAVTNVFNGIMKVIKFVMPFVLAIIKSVWGNIKGVISGALDVIMGLVKVFSGLFTGDFKKMWEGLKQIFKGAVTFIWNFVQLTLYGKILGGAKVFITAFRSFFTNMWKALVALFQGNVTRMLRLVTVGFGRMRQTAVDIFTKVLAFFRNIWSTLKNITTGTINFLKTAFTNGFARMFSTVKTGLGNIKTWFTNIFRDIYNAVKGRFSDIVSLAKGLPKRIGDGIGKMASKVGTGVTKVINKMASTLGKGINGVIGGINTVLGKIGVNTEIELWDIPQWAQGTPKGGHPGGLALVNDGKGANSGKELIRTPDGKMGTLPGRNVVTNLPKGTQVLSAKKTKEWMKGVPAYEWGTDAFEGAKNLYNAGKNKVKEVGSKIKDWTVDVFDYIKNPSGLLNLALDKLGIKRPSETGFVGDMAKGAFNKVKDAGVDKIKTALDAFGASASGPANFGGAFRKSSSYGWRTHPVTGVRTFHNGDDWAAPAGTPIPNQAAGRVVQSGYHSIRGNYVRIKSGDFERIYQHNTKNLVGVGEMVRKGQIIGTVGSTGRSTGPHLHYELLKNGEPISPGSFTGGSMAGAGGVGGLGVSAASKYLSAIVGDGDWMNDWVTHLPKGVIEKTLGYGKQAAGYIGKYGKPAKDYFDAIADDGDWMNDWATHVPKSAMSGLLKVGKYLAGIQKYADGGIVDQAQLAWIAEGGWAESIISHDPAKRVSQKAIWEQTGKELGFDTNNPAVLDMLDRIRIAVEQGHVIEMSDKLVGRAVAPYVTKEQKRGRGIQSVFES